eukprot:CAMPEP_0170763456 /NCGR_PEP_ID=MMETSP0733-20121128/3404_1 /TAXON_ID=186038 /ORGANISM="Fragilariopsis kerguelensis, Strain L26-C5" /LENGTH=36 /DNA_ID= /DNA_START= /DNA_END= /DNA_ORIENTATION=
MPFTAHFVIITINTVLFTSETCITALSSYGSFFYFV